MQNRDRQVAHVAREVIDWLYALLRLHLPVAGEGLRLQLHNRYCREAEASRERDIPRELIISDPRNKIREEARSKADDLCSLVLSMKATSVSVPVRSVLSPR